MVNPKNPIPKIKKKRKNPLLLLEQIVMDPSAIHRKGTNMCFHYNTLYKILKTLLFIILLILRTKKKFFFFPALVLLKLHSLRS